MKKVEQLKAGMEVWMKFRVEENNSKTYPFKIPMVGIFSKDCRLYEGGSPIEMYTIDENEIHELKGVEMEMSNNNVNWIIKKVLCKHEECYITNDYMLYKHARPIQKTFDLSNVPEHLLTDELKQYLR